MPSEPVWLLPADLIEINRFIVEQSREAFLVRDPGLLESACMRPRQRWHYAQEEDVLRLAVSLLYGIVKNHAFEQGNKRTGTLAALEFIEINGYRWTRPNDEQLGYWVLALVEDRLSEEMLAEFMRPWVVMY